MTPTVITATLAAPVLWPQRYAPNWLRQEFFSVALWQVVGLLILIFIALLLRQIAFYVLSSQLRKLVGRVIPRAEEGISRGALPLSAVVLAAVMWVGFPLLGFSERIDMVVEVAVRVVAVASSVWFFYRQIDLVAMALHERAERTETKLDDQLVPLVRRTMKAFVIVIGGIFVLQNLKVDVASLVAGLGLGGLAFALAAKDTLANVFGSLVIFVDRPFQIGDWVVIGNIEGTVEDVGFRTTRIRTFYNSQVTVPNAKLTDTSIDNMGRRQYRRIKMLIGLTYDTTPEQMQAYVEGLRAIIAAHPHTRKDYYEVHFYNFGAFALEILVYAFVEVPGWSDELKARHEFLLSAMTLAEAMGVSFAFPTQTLHLETNVDRRVPHKSPDSTALRDAVNAFGPAGSRANPRFELTHGYTFDTIGEERSPEKEVPPQ